MRGSACRTSAVAATMLVAWCVSAVAQDYAGREKLRARSNELRKEVIRVTDGVYVAVGYSASNVIVIQGDGGSIIVDTSTDPAPEQVLVRGREALAAREVKWAAELADYVLA